MKKVSLILSALVLTAALLSSCGEPFEEVPNGKQVWMTENLNVDKFRNGDPIPEAKTDAEWKKADIERMPAWCYYNNDPTNGTKYGKLYNWYAVNDPRILAPVGWHVPSDTEWTTFTEYLGGESVAGKKMKSTSGWGDNGNGTNESGFAGLPGGYRDDNGWFIGIGGISSWWSSTEVNANDAWIRYLSYFENYSFKDSGYEGYGLSVRCLRD